MKYLQSTIENSWKELINIEPTTEQLAILNNENTDANTLSLQKTVLDNLKSQQEKNANAEDIIIAESIYMTHKPIINIIDKYELISIDITIIDNIANGIINYRINNEHNQIRF